MDFNFQAVFSHINPTTDQMKAILQDFWRKNEENQAEIVKLQRKEAESRAEIERLRYENEICKGENCRLRQENNEHLGEYFKLRQENEQSLHEIALLEHENDEKLTTEIQKKTREIINQIDLSKPSCPVCLEHFDTEACQPYALSCEHMVCAQCLYPVLR